MGTGLAVRLGGQPGCSSRCAPQGSCPPGPPLSSSSGAVSQLPATGQSCPSELGSGEGKMPSTAPRRDNPIHEGGSGESWAWPGRPKHFTSAPTVMQGPRMAPQSQGQGQPPAIATYPCHSPATAAQGLALLQGHGRVQHTVVLFPREEEGKGQGTNSNRMKTIH